MGRTRGREEYRPELHFVITKAKNGLCESVEREEGENREKKKKSAVFAMKEGSS